MGVSGAAGLGQNIRQTTGLLSRWWSLAYDGEWFPRFLAARSMLGTARVVVTFWCAVFVALAVLAQFVKGGATELPERLAAGAACMIALYCMIRWSLGRSWPSHHQSVRFVSLTNICLSLILLAGIHSSFLALTGTVLFVVVANYSSVFHSPRIVTAQITGALFVVALLTIRAVTDPDTDSSLSVSTGFVIGCVIASAAMTVHFLVLYLTDDARHSWRDPLTAALNRRGLHNVWQQLFGVGELQGHVVLAVVIDVDSFKSVNDKLGHAEGDRMLVTVGRRLNSVVGEVGLVARTGGDEFVILMPVEPRRIEQTVVDIHNSISRPAGRQSISVSVGASVWLSSTIPDASGTIDRILADADNAMYRAKRRGGDQVAWAVTHLS